MIHLPHNVCRWCMVLLMPVSLFAEEADTIVSQQTVIPEVKENTLNIDLHLLTHGEIRDGGMSQSTIDDKTRFIMSRERLVIGYEMPWLETKLNIQHSGLWGESGKGTFNVYEAWAKIHTKGLFAQFGRIALAYDDERIIGPDDWAMTALSHDVLRLGYEGHGHKAHAILAYNQNSNNLTEGGSYYADGDQPYKTMHTVWYHYDVPHVPIGASVLFMNVGMQAGEKDEDPHTEYQQLLGTYITFRPKHWKLEASYYHQFGKNDTGMKIDAWMASGKVDWTPITKIGVEGGYDYMSGDKYFAVPGGGQIGVIHHDVIRGFNPIYGSHHDFYGAMDFFYVSTYISGFTPGLQNAFIGAHYHPFKGMTVKADYHYLATATNLEDMHKTLGHEIEIQAAYSFNKYINLSAGFSYMSGTETMDKLKRANGSGSLRWGWISLNVTPRILSYKW